MSQDSYTMSVITPVYNGEKYIEGCLRNVISQSCPCVEHIIVDGASSDKTPDIIKKYSRQYAHIKWISEKDKGQSDAMNKGILMARGGILSFLNVDDYYEPGALNDALDIIAHLPEPSLLVGNCNVWNNDDKLWFVSKPSMISLKNLLLGRYVEAFPMNSSAYFYHKSLHDRVGLYEIGEHYGMDMHFIFHAVQQAKVTYVDKTWGNYRYIEGTKTYEDDKSGGNKLRVMQITENYRKQQPLYYRLYLAAIEYFLKIINHVCKLYYILRRS